MVLSIRNGEVCLGFDGKQNRILQDIDLDIEKGKFVSIIGHSGCGKTTLLRTIAGLQKLTSGDIKYNTSSKSVGWVPQFPVLMPNKTILENICLPLTIHNNFKHEEDAKDIAKKYNLEKFLDTYPNQLSGGMKQKASIIRALVTKPSLLLMDEPFSSIDQYTRDTLNIDLANKLRNEKTTTVLVTHSIEEAVFLSDLVVIMMPKTPSTVYKTYEIVLPKGRTKKLKNSTRYMKQVSEIRNIMFSLSDKYYEN